jgi:hypothetical protein
MTFRKDVKSKDQVAGRGAKKQGTREGLPAGALRVETDTPTEKKHPGFVRICSNQGKTVALQLLDVAHGFAVKLARDTPRTHQEIHQGSCVKIKR